MSQHSFDLAASRDRMRRTEAAINAQRSYVAHVIGEEKSRAERTLIALIEMRIVLGEQHVALITGGVVVEAVACSAVPATG